MSGTMTLNELTHALAQFNEDVEVEYRGGGLDGQRPCNFDSWRGIYAELALEHYATVAPVLVRDLYARCLDANGRTFEGYKGGDYTMCGSTSVWVDNYGDYNERGITAVKPLHCADGRRKALIYVTDYNAEV